MSLYPCAEYATRDCWREYGCAYPVTECPRASDRDDNDRRLDARRDRELERRAGARD